jgi:hypothetical protein
MPHGLAAAPPDRQSSSPLPTGPCLGRDIPTLGEVVAHRAAETGGSTGGEAVTAAELVRMLLRRWYLTLVGAIGSLALLWVALHQPPIYFTQLDVVILPPAEQGAGKLLDSPWALAPLGGLIVADVNGDTVPLQTGSVATTLYGEGVRDGERVRLVDRGGQWQSIFDVGVIDVQVVGADPEEVGQRARALVIDLERALAERQLGAHVDPRMRASLESSPADPAIQQVGASRARAAGAIAVLGAGLTFLTVVFVDRRLRGRSARTTARSAVPMSGRNVVAT